MRGPAVASNPWWQQLRDGVDEARRGISPWRTSSIGVFLFLPARVAPLIGSLLSAPTGPADSDFVYDHSRFQRRGQLRS
jgi:hypothetical protein